MPYRQNYNLNTACQCRKNTHRVQFLLIFIKIGSGPTENSILSELIYAMTSDMAIDLTCDMTSDNGGKFIWKS